MDKLTKDEITKVFAMYWGCPIDAGLTTVVDSYWIDKVAHDQTDTVLKLTPLSKITDEDAIEVASIFFVGDNLKVTREYREGKATVVTKQETNEMLVINVNVDKVDPLFLYFWGEGKVAQNLGHGYYIDVIDKLRQLGYALPYKGIDLFEAGIAIEKQ